VYALHAAVQARRQSDRSRQSSWLRKWVDLGWWDVIPYQHAHSLGWDTGSRWGLGVSSALAVSRCAAAVYCKGWREVWWV